MRKVIPFERRAVASNTLGHLEAECAHRNLRLIEQSEIVMCAVCHVTLNPFWALSMLSEQYSLSMARIDRLKSRIELADARILELSQELDAILPGEKKPE
ncbi:hypothetical protein [Caballeronia sp. RCC_10]|uniref:hypothetical protein n=1 Tax=Caballeronia sp. RCC_10 TaxID=3239227 RepID=UPI0035250B16